MKDIRMTAEEKHRRGFFQRAIQIISDIFMPVIPVLTAGGILEGLLVLAASAGILSESAGTYRILYALADGFFYYLPVFLGISASKRLGVNIYAGALVGAALLYPDLAAALGEEGGRLTFLGLPVISATYQSSVIPVLLGMLLMRYVQRLFEKILPKLIQPFFVPLFSVLIVFPAVLLVFGPIGTVIGNLLAGGYQAIYSLSPVAAACTAGFLLQPMVMMGFHWGLIPIVMNNLSVSGTDTIMPLFRAPGGGQTGAVLAVALRTRQKERRAVAMSAAVSCVFGVTEPALFGVNVPLRKPMIFGCIGGGIGNCLTGLSGTLATAFAFPGLATLPVFMGQGFLGMLAAWAVAFVIGFLLTWIFWKPEMDE